VQDPELLLENIEGPLGVDVVGVVETIVLVGPCEELDGLEGGRVGRGELAEEESGSCLVV